MIQDATCRSQAGASPTSVAIRGLSSSPVLQPVQCQQPPKSEATSPERDPLADQVSFMVYGYVTDLQTLHPYSLVAAIGGCLQSSSELL